MEIAGGAPIDPLLAPLGPSERGFVLGLLLSRGQAEREEIATMLPGDVGRLCRAAIRDANRLSREGRLHLIRRLASEALGFRPCDGESFPTARFGPVLDGESEAVLAVLAEQAGDRLGDAARSILTARLTAWGDIPTPRPTASGANDMRVELRRAVVAQLEEPARAG